MVCALFVQTFLGVKEYSEYSNIRLPVQYSFYIIQKSLVQCMYFGLDGTFFLYDHCIKHQMLILESLIEAQHQGRVHEL